MSPPIHPMLVHFPVALVLLVAALDWGRWLFDRDRLLRGGFWDGTTPILIAALGTVMAAIVSGLSAKGAAAPSPAVADLLADHELTAFVTAGLVSILTFWRIALRGGFPRRGCRIYLLLGAIAAVGVAYGAYLGGDMVFTHGTGVANSHPQ